ncbi:olfactory receptor 11A1-like [Melanotaenia boesemani]|uniref:olfactory receptor 11A1-like n=1 Tax=Melanotaenia boesemani TaxID=1250792 RepID=UPI001C04430D|nr:olfactory receptor 11A1-like [Melanotaenia boesemani]
MENSTSLNVTTYIITFDGYVDLHKFSYLYFVLTLTVYILIIFSNVTIVYLISAHQSLHEPMYVFIAALLLNTVLSSTNIYPKMLIDFLSDKQVISYSACLFQFFLFYSLGGSEFFILAAMAYDRYVSICKPLQYPNIMTNTTIIICLCLAWFVPVLQTTTSLILLHKTQVKLCNFDVKGIFCNNAIYTLHCSRPRSVTILGVLAVVDSVILPLLFIVFTYTKILIIAYRSCKEVRKKAAETCLPHLLVLFSLTFLSAYDIVIVRIESDVPKMVQMIMTLQIFLYHPLFNPIIYGLKMKEIYKHLKQLLCQLKII